MFNLRAITIGSAMLALIAVTALGQGRRGGAPGPVSVHEEPTTAGIAWFGTWDAALAEAKRTKRPILLMAAAPQCNRVPGVW